MKILAIGDPHAKLSTLPDLISLAKKTVELVQKENIYAIVILGDLFNDFSRIHSLVLRGVTEFFEILLSSEKKIFCIAGNHDMINNQVFLEDYHALTPYRGWPGLTIIDKPTMVGRFLFTPYVAPGRFKESIAEHLSNNPLAIFCHQEFKGAKMGMIESSHGDEWADDMPLVISGHVHDYAWLRKNVLYVGTPMSQAFGESDDKTVSILEFSKDGFISEARVDLGLPKRITVNLTVEEAKDYIVPKNTHVRINITGTTEELVAFKKTNKYTELAKEAKVVPKCADKVVVRAATQKRKYLDILKAACSGESQFVLNAFDELTQTEGGNSAA